MTNTIRDYYFSDEQVDFILRLVRNNAQFEDEEREFYDEVSDLIEGQIAKHKDRDALLNQLNS